MRFSPEDFQYVVLEKNGITQSPYLELYGQAFALWKTTWKSVFESVGSPQAFQIDDFYRQDKISIIMHDHKIVGLMLHTYFDLKNPVIHEMRYFSIFGEWAMKNIKKHGGNGVMTMEFLMVTPEWRKRGGNFSFADVLAGLAFELMRHENAGICLGVAVKAAKVDEIAERLKCQILAKDVKRGNLVCDIVSQIPKNMATHPDANTQMFIENLWNNRLNSNRYKSTYKKVA